MKRGLVRIVVALSVAVFVGAGCGGGAKPVTQAEAAPPLPPTAGTPIGHLVDAAAELALSEQQLGKVKEINDELALQLGGDDAGLHPDPVPASRREDKDRQRGLGFHAAGARNDGTSGGQSGFPGIAAGDADHGQQPRQIAITSETANEVYQARARHVRDAVRRALALLDAAQQATARRILVDHGVNLDTGEVAGDFPGGAKPEDPTAGKPLPREQ